MTGEHEVLGSNPDAALIFKFLIHFLTVTSKRIEMLTKIHAKITITVLENREPYYYFITICKCKEGIVIPIFLPDVQCCQTSRFLLKPAKFENFPHKSVDFVFLRISYR